MDNPLDYRHVTAIVRGLSDELGEGLMTEDTLADLTEFSPLEKDYIKRVLDRNGPRSANDELLNVVQRRPRTFAQLIASIKIARNDDLLIKIWDYVKKYFDERNRPDLLQQLELRVNRITKKHISQPTQENDTGAAGGAPIDPIELGDGGIDNGANTPMASIENGSGDADTLDDKEETLVSATGPITQEHMNYLRICNMIATVFADPLRDILLSQVPTGYTTIYKPPIDQPRDVSLSASVERIRLLRNNVWGHSVDGKFDEKACKDYLGEISQILDDVEAALGDKGYKGALEDRRKLDRLQMEENMKAIVETIENVEKAMDIRSRFPRNLDNHDILEELETGQDQTTDKDKGLAVSSIDFLKDDDTIERLAKVLQNVIPKDTVEESINKVSDEEIDDSSYGDSAPKSVETSTNSSLTGSNIAAETDENISSNTGNIVRVDDAQKSADDSRIKHDELLLKDLKAVIFEYAEGAGDGDHAEVSVWDFGGQFAFYTTHQMFLSRRAVYILVIDMSRGIDTVVMDDEPYFDCSGSKSLKIEDFLDIWLNSIHGHSDRENQGTPPVILVGTHADKLNADTRNKDTEAMFDAIRNRFCGKDVSLHFIDKDFGLSNAEEDPKLDDLRKTIFEVAKKQPYWGEMKPAKWIPRERLLEELRREGVEIMSHSEVNHLNQNLPVPLAGDELELFLRFQHESASIMYFSVPELHNNIVLSPQFLVNALKSLITAEMFCKKKADILDKWMEFRQKGILRTSLIDAIWNREENRKFRENREHILALMEHLNIIARPVLYTDDDETQDYDKDYYLVPCMLKESPPESAFHAEGPFISTPCLCLDLENVAFPSAIFNRLLVGCMAYWPLAKSGKKYHIYCGCGQFDVDVQHRLTLTFHFKVVSLRITRFSQTNRKPSLSICNNVHSTVKRILERISKYLSLMLMFEEYIQCPLNPTDAMTCMHSIEKLRSCDEFPCHEHDTVAVLYSCDLLKYWFELKDRDQNNSLEDSGLPSVLAPDIANRVPTQKELVKIAQGIGLEFQRLFLELGIADARIGQIRGSNPLSVADQVVQLLLEWRKQRGCLATFRELETAMNSVGTDTMQAFKGIL